MIDNLFLSVGAMKAGTTWLYEQLKRHPEIFFGREKEVHYFYHVNGLGSPLGETQRLSKLKAVLKSIDLDKLTANDLEVIRWYTNYATSTVNDIWYQSLFADRRNQTYCADFSNLYAILNEDGWRRVRQNCKKLRVVYTMRDPIKRIWSHYKFHMKFIGMERSIEQNGFEGFKNLIEKPWFWEHAEYAKIVQSLKQNLQEEELLILYFEDFRMDPIGELKKVERFLGIKEINYNTEQLQKKVNTSKEMQIPEDWKNFTKERLASVLNELSTIGINRYPY